jgi:hypothetical protein
MLRYTTSQRGASRVSTVLCYGKRIKLSFRAGLE